LSSRAKTRDPVTGRVAVLSPVAAYWIPDEAQDDTLRKRQLEIAESPLSLI